MNRFLLGCGIAAIVAIGVLGALVAMFMMHAPAVEADAKQAAREAVLAVVTTWNPDDLLKRGSRELDSAQNRAKIGRLFSLYRRLGTLKNLGDPQGTSEMKFLLGAKHNGVTARYSFKATFSAGDATVTIRTRKETSGWKITAFRIDSDAFLQ
jgi:hypothetical protein